MSVAYGHTGLPNAASPDLAGIRLPDEAEAMGDEGAP